MKWLVFFIPVHIILLQGCNHFSMDTDRRTNNQILSLQSFRNYCTVQPIIIDVNEIKTSYSTKEFMIQPLFLVRITFVKILVHMLQPIIVITIG